MIQAIQTSYKGYRFRSRLEARWAVFFDALGLKWEYEPEGFDLGEAGYYLPDFRVQTPQGTIRWYEVKPTIASDDGKFHAFIRAINRDADAAEFGPRTGERIRWQFGSLLTGDPMTLLAPSGERTQHVCPRCGYVGEPTGGLSTHGEAWFGCWPCDNETPGGEGETECNGVRRLEVKPHKGSVLLSLGAWQTHQVRVAYAAKRAREARFEHGESGASR